ncbi:MAG: hypothetical protein ACOCRU_02030 [bacterium]
MFDFFKDKPFKCFIAEYENNDLISRSYQGVKAIDIDKIVGTVGRCHDNSSWRELKDKVRFKNIKEAIENMESMPAIQVYQVDDEYYIVDGHHRVMASRDIDRHFIDAEVIEYKFKEDSGEKKCPDYHDCPGKSFSKKTSLKGLLLKSRSAYTKVFDMIKEFSKKIEENMTLQEYSQKWYQDYFLVNKEEVESELEKDSKEN